MQRLLSVKWWQEEMEWSHQFLSHCHKILRWYNLNLTYNIIQDENAFVPRINHLTYSATSPSRHHDEPNLSPHDGLCLHTRGENTKKTDMELLSMIRGEFRLVFVRRRGWQGLVDSKAGHAEGEEPRHGAQVGQADGEVKLCGWVAATQWVFSLSYSFM